MEYIESFGALFSPRDVRDYRLSYASPTTKLPKTFELKMPNVKNQGEVNSCVAHSISTIIEYFNQTQEHRNEEMSVGYIYGNRASCSHHGPGMYLRDALSNACKYGDVAKRLFPYNQEVPEIITKFNTVSSSLFEKGEPNRFTSYYRLYNEREIKTSLMKNGPVAFGMKWYDDIKVVDGVITTKQESSAYGGHCMVIYGWDERGWKIQNSWGIWWGNRGRAILPYDIEIMESWGIIDTLTNPDINIKKPYNNDCAKIAAKIMNAVYNKIDSFKNKK